MYRRLFTKMKYIGTHVSASSGPKNAILHAQSRNATTFALFLASPRSYNTSPFSEKDVKEFEIDLKASKFKLDKLLPHGSYLINLASPKPDILEKSKKLFFTELQKCNQLGIKHYNLHPGSATDKDTKSGMERIAEAINAAHRLVPNVVVVLENMAGQGNVLGRSFEELANIISMITDKDRIGVCLDTCHLFAAGYDLREAGDVEKVLRDFDKIVTRKYLKAFHINDSKEELGKKKDRHEDLGIGKIGMKCFETLMKDKSLDELIFILETPGSHEIQKDQIKTLTEFSLSMNPDERVS